MLGLVRIVIGVFVLLATPVSTAQVVTINRDSREVTAFSESLGAALNDDREVPDPISPGVFGPFSGRASTTVMANGVAGVSSAGMTSDIGLLSMRGSAEVFCQVTASDGTGYGAGSSFFIVSFDVHQATTFVFEGTLSATYVANTGQGEVRVSADIFTDGPDPIDSIELLAEDGNNAPPAVMFMESGTLSPGRYEIQVIAEARNTELEGENAAGTGSFEFVLDFGDRDGDGLSDTWEENGIDLNGDGVPEIDLPALGADPDRKDLFVEIDAMQDRGPDFGVVGSVTAAFASAPVENPAGSQGITLHLLVDETDIPRVGWPDPWAGFDPVKAARCGTVAERARPDWTEYRVAKSQVYRYCVFADTIFGDGTSGISELPGNDFIVSLGRWGDGSGGFGGTIAEQAGTFMHEFGHALGLRHGGSDDIHHKPNYYSVMNYLWQTPRRGYSGWRLSYSGVRAPTLNENSLVEAHGNGASEYGSPKAPIGLNGTPPNPRLRRFTFVSMNATVADWNGDGMIDAVVTNEDPNYLYICQDAMPEPGCYQLPSPSGVMTGHDDWANLHYGLGNAPDFANGVRVSPFTGSLTEVEAEQLDLIVDPDQPCTPADLAAPFGVLDLADITACVEGFLGQQPIADLAPPANLWDLADITVFVQSFTGGCP